MTDAAPPPAPQTTAKPARPRAEAQRGPRSKATWAIVAIALVLGGGMFAIFPKLFTRTGRRLPVDWPVARAGGEAVRVGHAVAAGDRFESKVRSETHIVLGEDVDAMMGMDLYANMLYDHAVDAAGDGLRSTVTVRLDITGGKLPDLPRLVNAAIGGDQKTLSATLDRAADGTPVPGSAREIDGDPLRRQLLGAISSQRLTERSVLDIVLSGLTDLTTSYLPPREVRLGETWDLAEAAKLGAITDTIRWLATLSLSPDGFPAGSWKGRVGAEALEERDGEPCVRLKLAIEVLIEGDVVEPATPGTLSAVAKVEGSAWVSTRTGILWALDARSEEKSSYEVKRKRQERHALQTIVLATRKKA